MAEILGPILLLILGSGLLYGGAEALVSGALTLGASFGLSSLVAGFTVVAVGTSSPELAVTVMASFSGREDVALGNVVGSNIANIGLILGLGLMLRPVKAPSSTWRREFPLLLASSLLLLPVGWTGRAGRPVGALYIALYLAYLFWVWKTREVQGPYSIGIERAGDGKRRAKGLLLAAGGTAALVLGSKTFLKGALALAALFGISDLVVGLTLTAVGTSLPEIAATLSAARRGEGGIILGNVIGSNFANLALVLGTAGLLSPVRIREEAALRDIPLMCALTLALPFIFRAGRRAGRIEGWALFLAYLLYVLWISGILGRGA